MEWKCDYCKHYCGDPMTDEGKCPKRKVYDESQTIQKFLEAKPSDDPNELVARLTENNTYIARTGYLLAVAQKMQDEEMALVFQYEMASIKDLSATLAKKYVECQCSDINALVTMLERQNRALVHQSDNIRTQVSFEKENMALTRKGY